ncbi:hypothetical protein GCM10027020_17060 [Nocardioides salsibiostraticola]
MDSTVIIGVDPHKMSVTIEVLDMKERLLGRGRYATDQAGYVAMRTFVQQWPNRVWAVEGANGAGRPLTQRLVAAGERVIDVPAKLAARVRLFDTGHNRKTDALDAHSIAVVAVRTDGLRVVADDGELEALRMLTDRRDELARQRVQIVNRLQRLLSELLPGQRKRDLSAAQAKVMLATRAAPRHRRDLSEDGSRADRRPRRSRCEVKDGQSRVEGRGHSLGVGVDGPLRSRPSRCSTHVG